MLCSTTKDSLRPESLSAQRNGAHPIRKANFSGDFVHQVGNQSSSENRKLILSKVSKFLSRNLGRSLQNRSRNRSVTRTTLPIIRLRIECRFSSGSSGVN